LIGKAINPDRVAKKKYYREIIPQIDWAFMIIPGIIIGAFISAILSGQFHVVWVPRLWGVAFGYSPLIRHRCPCRRDPARPGCTLGGGMNEWLWDQRVDPALACQYRHGMLLFHRGDCNRPADIPGHRGLTGRE